MGGGHTQSSRLHRLLAMSVLSLSNPTLADGRDVYLSATRTALDLNFAATDTIRSLYIDGVAQATGTLGCDWFRSCRPIPSSLITGTGYLNVTGCRRSVCRAISTTTASSTPPTMCSGARRAAAERSGRRRDCERRQDYRRLASALRQSDGQRQSGIRRCAGTEHRVAFVVTLLVLIAAVYLQRRHVGRSCRLR